MKSISISFPFKIGFQDYHEADAHVYFLNEITPDAPMVVAEEIGFAGDPGFEDISGPYIFEFRLRDE